MPRVGFEPTISADEQLQTYAFDRTATGTVNIMSITLANSPAPLFDTFNILNAELNPICHFLALFGAHLFLHISRIRVNKACCPEIPIYELGI